MLNDPSVIALVIRARDGDKQAWDEIVERYAPLVWSICRRHGLARADIEDVGQSVWVRLVEQLPLLREPAALPGWIATTTRRECLRLLRSAQRQEPIDTTEYVLADERSTSVDHDVLLHERNVALRAAFAELPARCQMLLTMLMRDPPASYEEISGRMGIPVGSIGPSRARCLDRLRRCPALAALIDHDMARGGRGGDRHGQPVVE